MNSLTSVLAVTAIAASLLSGCGGDGDGGGSYCEAIESTQEDLQDLGSADLSGFDEFTDQVQEFADDAPDDVRDDWKVLADAFTAFTDALEDAGLEAEDLAGAAGGELPEGVDTDAFAEAMAAAQSLSTDEVVTALENIEQHAKDECNIEFEGA